jgi:hypothetical protein
VDHDQPKVTRVLDLASYQDGAVVSRVVLKRDTGSVTLFAFDAGQELSEHTTPYDALVQILDGEALLTIGGQPYRRQGHRPLQNAPHDDPLVNASASGGAPCLIGHTPSRHTAGAFAGC